MTFFDDHLSLNDKERTRSARKQNLAKKLRQIADELEQVPSKSFLFYSQPPVILHTLNRLSEAIQESGFALRVAAPLIESISVRRTKTKFATVILKGSSLTQEGKIKLHGDMPGVE
jgi:hypothetical protein